MERLISQPWPWYIAGPLIGLMVPWLLWAGNKPFGVSSNFRHICAACMPAKIPFFQYNWKKESWNLLFIAGVLIGGFLGYQVTNQSYVDIALETRQSLQQLGIDSFSGLVPAEIFNWGNLLSAEGIIFIILGGFLVGFGTRYAGGCTSGHAITGLANMQLASLVAVIGFFIGGLLTTYVLLPLILS